MIFLLGVSIYFNIGLAYGIMVYHNYLGSGRLRDRTEWLLTCLCGGPLLIIMDILEYIRSEW